MMVKLTEITKIKRKPEHSAVLIFPPKFNLETINFMFMKKFTIQEGFSKFFQEFPERMPES